MLQCATTTIAVRSKPHKISTFFQHNMIPNNMPAAKWTGGFWTKKQDFDLQELISSNTIDYKTSQNQKRAVVNQFSKLKNVTWALLHKLQVCKPLSD